MGEITWGTAAAALAAPFVFLLPGWALLSLLLPPERFAPERRPDAASWLILAVGLALAITPLGLLASYLVGLEVGSGLVLAVLALSAVIVLWRRGPYWWAWWRQSSWRNRLGHLDPPLLALALVTALVIGVRLWVVRGINIGFWADSYQHTMIVQLMLDNGGLFKSWEPYVPLRTFSYHFGFHGDVALFQWATGWLTGNPTPRTVVLVGQFMNALAALALYPLTVRLCGGNRWAGTLAVLVAGLLAPIPMCYVNWGRYTQLAGQVILPVALWFILEAVEERRRDWRRMTLAIVILAGLVLTHYRVAALAVTFLVPYLCLRTCRLWMGAGTGKERGRSAQVWLEPAARLALLGSAGLALVMPWLLHLGEGYYLTIASGFVQSQTPAPHVVEYNTVYDLKGYMPYILLVLAGLGALLSLWRRRSVFLAVPWAGLAFLMANPRLIGLPGTGLMTNFAITIALYIPVAMLVGHLGGEIVGLLSRWGQDRGGLRSTRLVGCAALAAILLLGLVGAQDRASVLDPDWQLATPADEQAMTWIQDHTPPNARFLVNSVFMYGGSSAAGSDAGWWIPLLTGRANTAPPIVYASEASFVPGYLSQVNDFVRTIQNSEIDDPATVQFLRQNGVSHVYIGEKGGPLLDVERLQASTLYRSIYHQGQVQIFEIVLDRK